MCDGWVPLHRWPVSHLSADGNDSGNWRGPMRTLRPAGRREHRHPLDFAFMNSGPITTTFNDAYIAELFEAYRRDPASVDDSWRQFFDAAQRFAESGAPA